MEILKNKNVLIGIGLFISALILNVGFDISYGLISYVLFSIGVVVGFGLLAINFLKSKAEFEQGYEEIEKEKPIKQEETFIQKENTVVNKGISFIEYIKEENKKGLIYPGFAAFFIGKGGPLIGLYGIPLLDLGEGFVGTANLFNAMITYFPIFFVLLNFKFVKSKLNKNS